ncbi:MAG: hypothetical protein PHD82_12970 [Candidatus Riflebacteria bacterium]|nr:hypothetical protein [Candidatus Riflebacteria bacterium]
MVDSNLSMENLESTWEWYEALQQETKAEDNSDTEFKLLYKRAVFPMFNNAKEESVFCEKNGTEPPRPKLEISVNGRILTVICDDRMLEMFEENWISSKNFNQEFLPVITSQNPAKITISSIVKPEISSSSSWVNPQQFNIQSGQPGQSLPAELLTEFSFNRQGMIKIFYSWEIDLVDDKFALFSNGIRRIDLCPGRQLKGLGDFIVCLEEVKLNDEYFWRISAENEGKSISRVGTRGGSVFLDDDWSAKPMLCGQSAEYGATRHDKCIKKQGLTGFLLREPKVFGTYGFSFRNGQNNTNYHFELFEKKPSSSEIEYCAVLRIPFAKDALEFFSLNKQEFDMADGIPEFDDYD